MAEPVASQTGTMGEGIHASCDIIAQPCDGNASAHPSHEWANGANVSIHILGDANAARAMAESSSTLSRGMAGPGPSNDTVGAHVCNAVSRIIWDIEKWDIVPITSNGAGINIAFLLPSPPLYPTDWPRSL